MRGKLPKRYPAARRHRIIPAHAGQTGTLPGRWSVSSDHPRACGANLRRSLRTAKMFGSSPRMRGKHKHAGSITPNPRIIPAHAGQTYAAAHEPAPLADHPRACGANKPFNAQRERQHGSSPRMRGKPGPTGLTLLFTRIIPAHAGQTEQSQPTCGQYPDHPRACGANALLPTLL